MQVTTVIKGAPDTLRTAINALAVANTINIVKRTRSAGSFIVVYDNAGPSGQSAEVVKGAPMDIAGRLNVLIAGGQTIDIVEQTFSAGFYLAVYR